MNRLIHLSKIQKKIFLIRNRKVMLDRDLAELYGVSTKVLNQAVKRNVGRFPSDFVFQLNEREFIGLRSQFVTSKPRGGRRFFPYAFTEHGAIMLASVLNSSKAEMASVRVVRAFIYLREMLSLNNDLARKLDDLERKYESHDKQITSVFEAIRRLMATPEKPKQKIGF